MFTYTAYILNRFGERNDYDAVRFSDLSSFVFDDLWRGQKLSFYESKEELLDDLRYLDRLNVVKLRGNVRRRIELNKEKLEKISNIVEDSGQLTGVALFDEYKRRIDDAFLLLK